MGFKFMWSLNIGWVFFFCITKGLEVSYQTTGKKITITKEEPKKCIIEGTEGEYDQDIMYMWMKFSKNNKKEKKMWKNKSLRFHFYFVHVCLSDCGDAMCVDDTEAIRGQWISRTTWCGWRGGDFSPLEKREVSECFYPLSLLLSPWIHIFKFM